MAHEWRKRISTDLAARGYHLPLSPTIAYRGYSRTDIAFMRNTKAGR
jgi:hypothetical protein